MQPAKVDLGGPQKCVICGAKFYSRADALYCTPKCRQQAVRNRRKVLR